jgi:hypothetical protein
MRKVDHLALDPKRAYPRIGFECGDDLAGCAISASEGA